MSRSRNSVFGLVILLSLAGCADQEAPAVAQQAAPVVEVDFAAYFKSLPPRQTESGQDSAQPCSERLMVLLKYAPMERLDRLISMSIDSCSSIQAMELSLDRATGMYSWCQDNPLT